MHMHSKKLIFKFSNESSHVRTSSNDQDLVFGISTTQIELDIQGLHTIQCLDRITQERAGTPDFNETSMLLQLLPVRHSSAAKHCKMLKSKQHAFKASKLQSSCSNAGSCCKALCLVIAEKQLGAAKHPSSHRATGKESHLVHHQFFFFKGWHQCQSLQSRFKNQTVKGWKFHPVCVGCWVRFSFVASVHRPIWVGAALSGPLRHCLNGSLNLDSPGYGGMNQSSNCLVGELKRRSRKGVGSPPCQVLDSLPPYLCV